MTPQELAAGEAAAKAIEGFKAIFIPEDIQVGSINLVFDAANAAKDQTFKGRVAAGTLALHNAAVGAGHGNDLSMEDAAKLVTGVLSAIYYADHPAALALRAHKTVHDSVKRTGA